ncbi:Uncharacterised protein [uncultured archaeon]|nr:Uncharacterised protein [uncultured archaeon]
MEHRELAFVLIMLIITIGIYGIYWLVKTRREMVDRGADIPTTFLIIIPIVNIFYIYKWSMGAAEVTRSDDAFGYIVFLLWLVLFPAAFLVAQDKFNAVKETKGRRR